MSDAGFDMNIYEQSSTHLCGYVPDCPDDLNSLWTQVEGTPVALSNAGTLCQAEFIPPAAKCFETLTLELTAPGNAGFPFRDDISLIAT